VEGDLFEAKDSPLVHCVSADLVVGAGIAKQFREKFQGLSDLRAQKLSVGKVGTLLRDKRHLFYLITKEKVHEKPTYSDLENSLVAVALTVSPGKRLRIFLKGLYKILLSKLPYILCLPSESLSLRPSLRVPPLRFQPPLKESQSKQ
jgi:hypothetical protein